MNPERRIGRRVRGCPLAAKGIEWPTVLVAACIYAAFGMLTLGYPHLPWFVVLPAGAYVVAWHGSLQHEVVHGHPTPWRAVNTALVFPSLWLWLPFEHYRETHLRHHRTEQLTIPGVDPESSYLEAKEFTALPAWRRTLLRCQRTLAGYMLIGPFAFAASVYWNELRKFMRDRTTRKTIVRIWAVHAASVALVFSWVTGVCGIPMAEYVLLFALPGMSLTLLRSFAEHQAVVPASGEGRQIPFTEGRQVSNTDGRTSIVEAEPPIALLFLNNNLHVLHHREPWRAWYELPQRYAEQHDKLVNEEGNQVYRGYREIARRFGLRAREPVVHPLA